jgi:hypothetical protein
MRHLMTEHAETLGAEGHGIVNRVNGALEFAEKLLATNPTYARVNPQVSERMTKLKGHDRNYLAHEYFNRDWHPMHFATMAEWLEQAKLSYACSAHYLDHIDAVNFSAEQLTLLKSIDDAGFRETVRDFMVNQQFRRDYWVKGARKLSPLEQAEAFRAQKVVLVQPRADVSLKVNGAIGEATLQDAVYSPILDTLADHKARALSQIEQVVKGVTYTQLTQAVMVLIGAGSLVAVQDEATIPKAKKYTDKLNAYLIDKARGSGDFSYLASPVTGGGFTVGRFQQMFLLAISQGKKQPAEWAQFTWQILAAQGQKIVKDGKALETPEENIAELTEQAQTFAMKQLPILKALQIT